MPENEGQTCTLFIATLWNGTEQDGTMTYCHDWWGNYGILDLWPMKARSAGALDEPG